MLKNWMGHFFYIGRASGQVWAEHYANIVASWLLLLISAVLLAASLAGYTLFLLYMRTKPGSSSRMLNVLLANMVAISMCENILMFIQVYLTRYHFTS